MDDTRDFILNELSLDDFDTRKHDALELAERFGAVWRALGRGDLWVWNRLLETPETGWHRLLRCLRAAKDKDRWRSAARVFDRAQPFADELASDVRYFPAPNAEGILARGLGRAARIGGLSLSLRTEDRWNIPWLDVTEVALRSESSELSNRQSRVRNAADRTHLAEHREWVAPDDVGRLRILLEAGATTHVSASNYRGGKHVRGATNDQRRMNARSPAGDAQYLAERDGQRITDATVQGWEQRVLDQVREGGACLVERHGGAYHIYCDLAERVGYLSPSGDPTSCVRVEWSAGHVHSHPRLKPKV